MASQRDRGYAWIILVASFLCQATSIGFSVGCIGITTLSYANAFPNATSSELSWIGSLRGSSQFLASLLAMPLAEKLGFQVVTVAGSLLAAGGVVASIYASELWHVYLAFGIAGGVGIACPYCTSMAILGDYFHKLKHIAFPVVGFGQGVGILVFPPILQALIASAGHASALVFTACIVLVNAACGLLFKPVDRDLFARCAAAAQSGNRSDAEKSAEARVSSERLRDGTAADSFFDSAAVHEDVKWHRANEAATDADGWRATATPCPVVLTARSNADETGDVAAAAASGREKGASRSGRTGVRGLLARWEIWMHVLNPFFWGTCTSATEALWPLLATTHGVSEDEAALGVTMSGVGFLVASIVVTATGKRHYDRYLLYALSGALCGASVLLAPRVPLAAGSYIALFTLFGWWLGFLLSLFMSVLSECVDPSDFGAVIALYNFMNGVGYFVGPIAIGTLDASYGESVSWTVCGCFCVFATLVLVAPYVASRRRQKVLALSAPPVATETVVIEAAALQSSKAFPVR